MWKSMRGQIPLVGKSDQRRSNNGDKSNVSMGAVFESSDRLNLRTTYGMDGADFISRIIAGSAQQIFASEFERNSANMESSRRCIGAESVKGNVRWSLTQRPANP